MKNNYAVIMAGGIGSRFWPMSTVATPKQFLDILGTGKSLLQQTFTRLSAVSPSKNIFVVTNDAYKELVAKQLPQIPVENILCEPIMRNTAPCIAYACYKINQLNPDARVVVAPSDHHIEDEAEFLDNVSMLLGTSGESDMLFTLGIIPTRPDTGYGYVQFEEKRLSNEKAIAKVKTFTEKPNLELACEFVKSGDFLWNSGIFVWSAKSIVRAFEKYLPEMNELFAEGNGYYNTEREKEYINRIYPACDKVSIDFGIMEKASNVYVLPASFGWSDLGTWRSLFDKLPKDVCENAVVNGNVQMYEAAGNIVRTDKDKLVVIKGLYDFIVVESDGVLLICPKEQEQSIKDVVGDLRAKGIQTGL